jgi:hypothetical protein
MTQTVVPSKHHPINLTLGPRFASFDKLKSAGSNALDAVKQGAIAKLETKTGGYVILEESDFQRLLGLARDVQRLRDGLELVIAAVEAVELHQDQVTIETLVRATKVVGRVPALPTHDGQRAAAPEGFEIDDVDVELNSENLTTPV